jgi:hypothetical protein
LDDSPSSKRIDVHHKRSRATGQDLGWQGAALERRTAEPGERSEEHIGHHFIILWDQQPALGARADLRGKFAPYAKYPGAISLGPAAFCRR